MTNARQIVKSPVLKPTTPRPKKAKRASQSLSARIARLSTNPREEIWKTLSLKSIRAAFLKIAPQQILALAMLTVAISVVDRPNVEAAFVLGSRFHISPTLFALVTIVCGALLLVRPYTAAFLVLTLPLAIYIIADVVYCTLIPNSVYTAPILFTALYWLVIRLALAGKKGG